MLLSQFDVNAFKPEILQVKDISGACSSMIVIDSSKFKIDSNMYNVRVDDDVRA